MVRVVMKQRFYSRLLQSFSFARATALFFTVFGLGVSAALSAQSNWADPLLAGDAAIAQRHIAWAQQAIDGGRWDHALAALERAADFSNVSSDLSYLLARARDHQGQDRFAVIGALQRALSTDIWVHYDADNARLLLAAQLIAMRSYSAGLSVLDTVAQGADEAALRLVALRALAWEPSLAAYATPAAVSQNFFAATLDALNRHPWDPRPASIFLEYARSYLFGAQEIAGRAHDIMDVVLRRLPFLLEADPRLAWMAAPFIRDTEEARRLVASYRALGASSLQTQPNFFANPYSIAVALNLGLIDDAQAVSELFDGQLSNGAFTTGYLEGGAGEMSLDLAVIERTWGFLRSPSGRELFTRRLLEFSGVIYTGGNGRVESRAFYQNGSLVMYERDMDNSRVADFRIVFGSAGEPLYADTFIFPDAGVGTPQPLPAAGHDARLAARVSWALYPSVQTVELYGATHNFRPAGFHFAPFRFTEIGGSAALSGLIFPVTEAENTRLTRRALVMASASIHRPSSQFPQATEVVYLEGGIPFHAFEVLDGRNVSVTQFEGGLPTVQHLDLDLDGRMETVRLFQRPPAGSDFWETLDFARLIHSSVSDWRGDGLFTTGRTYLGDGSVVYSWDLDGSGYRDHTETR